MVKIDNNGEIIRDDIKNDTNLDSNIPTFTPPKQKMQLEHIKAGDEILNSGAIDFKGVKYDLGTLANLVDRIEEEIRSGKDENFYSTELLTIGIQMLKKAHSTIVESSSMSPNKEEALAQILERQHSLQEEGMILNADSLLRKKDMEETYMSELYSEMMKQKELDQRKAKEEASKHATKMPKISAKPSWESER